MDFAVAAEIDEQLEMHMGLLDNITGAIKGLAGQAEAAALPALLSAALAKTSYGNMRGLVDKLQRSGLGAQVSSWLGDGQNIPITADQLRTALGNEQIQQIASHLGVPVDTIFEFLAEHLPAVVDKLSPKGELQEAA